LSLSIQTSDDLNNLLHEDVITKANGEPYSESSKRKFNDTLIKYHEWRADEHGGQEWAPTHQFNQTSHKSADEFTAEERRKLREVSLSYDTIPSYSDCTPGQRDKLKSHLAQKLGKPKDEITPEVWRQHNRSWERASLLYVSLDAALRPIEVERANTNWPRSQKQTLYIPRGDAAKSRECWEVALRPQTAKILDAWLDERSHLTKYKNTDKLWLTREANPWTSGSLNYLLDQLCDAANIDQTNRHICWYSIRHSVGELMAEKGGLHQTKEQLRHKSLDSTLVYATPSAESRQSTLNEM
jgi:integrase